MRYCHSPFYYERRKTREIIVGNPAAVIAKRAEELGCDGIVMGTQGRSAMGSVVMGSVALKVVHLTNLPVTLVT